MFKPDNRRFRSRRGIRPRPLYPLALVVGSTLILAFGLGYGIRKVSFELAGSAKVEDRSSNQGDGSIQTHEPVSTPTPATTPTPLDATPTISTPSASIYDPTSQKEAINQVIASHSELIIGVSILNLETGKRINLGSQNPFTAASTTKMISALLFLKGVDEGKYTLDQMVGGYNAQAQLTQLINRSNNDSWERFGNLVTWPGQESYTRSLGIQSYTYSNNKISAADFTTLLALFYQGKLLGSANQKLLLSLMQNTNEESYLPASLPSGTIVYHKYGIYEDNVNDGGIVLFNNQPVVISIYTNGKGYQNYIARAKVFKELVTAAFNL